jgi:hypothetical protein
LVPWPHVDHWLDHTLALMRDEIRESVMQRCQRAIQLLIEVQQRRQCSIHPMSALQQPCRRLIHPVAELRQSAVVRSRNGPSTVLVNVPGGAAGSLNPIIPHSGYRHPVTRTGLMATGFRTSFPFLSKQITDWNLAKTPPPEDDASDDSEACSSSACSSP